MTHKYWAKILFVMLVLSYALTIGCQKAQETTTEVIDKTAETASSITDNVSGKADVIKEKAVEANEKVVAIASDVKETASDTAVAVKEKGAENISSSKTEITEMITTTRREYLGAKKCKTCHLKQYRSWAQTKMATSFANLKSGMKEDAKKKAGLDPSKDYRQDANCVRCHTTGYGKGGFVSMEKTPDLANVQCESCHGPGSDYKVIMRKNKEFRLAEVREAGLIIPSEDERGCLECHGSDSPFNEKLDPKYRFDFKERLKNTHKHFPLKYKH